METQSILPTNEAQWLEMRSLDLTSTEVSALFELSPYSTMFETWHRKKEKTIVKLEGNDRMKWGTRLQDAIALGVAEDNAWKVEPYKEYSRIAELRMGSSFDFAILDAEGKRIGILEIKNVDGLQFRDGWLEDDEGNIEAPPHIELQVQHQLAVSGLQFAYIAALVGGNTVALIRRERDEKIIDQIKAKVAQFWLSIDKNIPPKPDFERDADFIASLYQYAEVDKIYDGTKDAELFAMATEYKIQAEAQKIAEAKKQAVKAQILIKIKDAEKAVGMGFSISAGMIGPAEISYTRDPYRNFRVNWKKVKTNAD